MEILVPCSLGDLYDKISILRLKFFRITDREKLKNVVKELKELEEIAKKYPIDRNLEIDLYEANFAIWEIEDSIREKERKKEFDKEFIEIARSVYKTNDRRASVKREINQKYGSDIVEEKSYKEY